MSELAMVCVGVCTHEQLLVLLAGFYQVPELSRWSWSVVCHIAGSYQEVFFLLSSFTTVRSSVA